MALGVLLMSAIAWLRFLRGAPQVRNLEGRYLLLPLVIIGVVAFAAMPYKDLNPSWFGPNPESQVIWIAGGAFIALVLLLLWLASEIARYRAFRADGGKRGRRAW